VAITNYRGGSTALSNASSPRGGPNALDSWDCGSALALRFYYAYFYGNLKSLPNSGGRDRATSPTSQVGSSANSVDVAYMPFDVSI